MKLLRLATPLHAMSCFEAQFVVPASPQDATSRWGEDPAKFSQLMPTHREGIHIQCNCT